VTKDDLAAHIVLSALTTAHADLDVTSLDAFVMPMDVRLDKIVPRYRNTGRARFAYGLAHAAKGLELRTVVPAMTTTTTVTVGSIVEAVTLRLPARLYVCKDPDRHVYKEFGDGKCRIDDAELVELRF
jgi:hypothetical protein